ncbi:PREDICTED: chymotrypsin inhibitor-like [Eufriesea mexicana]|uniref:chymotrypsin inhibitor-like n=1 Tax=Eufriesea mexicana TaxID=516756 RepID=UPI00083C6CAD|nr:PREDICTED: chymotrypsin inhibitor-like [Eufriesea mexicana]
MSRILLVCLVVMAVFTSSFGQQCGLNEEFRTCGSACEPSCAKPRLGVCTYQCKIGCQCKTGFLRNGEGTCVAPADC